MGISRAINQSLPLRSAVSKLVLRGILFRFRHWRRSRRAERELLALDDRLLKDIGMCRTDIPDAVRGRRKVSTRWHPTSNCKRKAASPRPAAAMARSWRCRASRTRPPDRRRSNSAAEIRAFKMPPA